jgi:hypothetical protein
VNIIISWEEFGNFKESKTLKLKAADQAKSFSFGFYSTKENIYRKKGCVRCGLLKY